MEARKGGIAMENLCTDPVLQNSAYNSSSERIIWVNNSWQDSIRMKDIS